jgi:hypothetical protein
LYIIYKLFFFLGEKKKKKYEICQKDSKGKIFCRLLFFFFFFKGKKIILYIVIDAGISERFLKIQIYPIKYYKNVIVKNTQGSRTYKHNCIRVIDRIYSECTLCKQYILKFASSLNMSNNTKV